MSVTICPACFAMIEDGECPKGPIRTAVVIEASQPVEVERVREYLPKGYQAHRIEGRIIISGHDNAGWTLEDYVMPRLWSGMIGVEELR